MSGSHRKKLSHFIEYSIQGMKREKIICISVLNE